MVGKGKDSAAKARGRGGQPGDSSPTALVKMTVTLPRSVAAFLRWKAEVDGMKRDELLRRIVTGYANELRGRDANIPPIEE